MRLPEIYQIELTNECNFNCAYCQRVFGEGERPKGYVDMKLLKRMAERGDLGGTSFMELQQNGEPTLHPEFGKIVTYLKAYVPFIGMSTNGSLIDKWYKSILELDCLTISIHPQTNTIALDESLKRLYGRSKTKIRLQILTNANAYQRRLYDKWKRRKYIKAEVFPLQDYLDKKVYKTRGCINPWYSVSVQWDGDVVPCCKAVGKRFVYGNLFKNSLETIWKNDAVEQMRRYHLGKEEHSPICGYCDFKSPHKFHMNILEKSL